MKRIYLWIAVLVLWTVINVAVAMYPTIWKSKAYNFHNPGVDAFEITLDSNNTLYIWREINGELAEVANIENFCEQEESQ